MNCSSKFKTAKRRFRKNSQEGGPSRELFSGTRGRKIGFKVNLLEGGQVRGL